MTFEKVSQKFICELIMNYLATTREPPSTHLPLINRLSQIKNKWFWTPEARHLQNLYMMELATIVAEAKEQNTFESADEPSYVKILTERLKATCKGSLSDQIHSAGYKTIDAYTMALLHKAMTIRNGAVLIDAARQSCPSELPLPSHRSATTQQAQPSNSSPSKAKRGISSISASHGARSSGGSQTSSSHRSNPQGDSSARPTTACRHCGRTNHSTERCRLPQHGHPDVNRDLTVEFKESPKGELWLKQGHNEVPWDKLLSGEPFLETSKRASHAEEHRDKKPRGKQCTMCTLFPHANHDCIECSTGVPCNIVISTTAHPIIAYLDAGCAQGNFISRASAKKLGLLAEKREVAPLQRHWSSILAS